MNQTAEFGLHRAVKLDYFENYSSGITDFFR